MMRALGLVLGLLLTAGAARAASVLSPSFVLQPSSVDAGQTLTLAIRVSNTGSSQMLAVSSSVEAYGSGGSTVALVATPVPFSNPVAASASVTFTWIFSAGSCGGSIYFSAYATGYNTSSNLTETAGPVSSNLIPVNCVTATPSPTISPTSTVSPTPTPSPWVVYSTATPIPPMGDAQILGNVYHPDQGQPMQLRFSVPLEGSVQIDLYNRIGAHIRHIERSVAPGSYTELWDGRNDQGATVSTGIYVAQFKAKGLFKTVKFAVIK